MLKYINNTIDYLGKNHQYTILFQGKPIVVWIVDGELVILTVAAILHDTTIPWAGCKVKLTEINKIQYLDIDYDEPNDPPEIKTKK